MTVVSKILRETRRKLVLISPENMMIIVLIEKTVRDLSLKSLLGSDRSNLGMGRKEKLIRAMVGMRTYK